MLPLRPFPQNLPHHNLHSFQNLAHHNQMIPLHTAQHLTITSENNLKWKLKSISEVAAESGLKRSHEAMSVSSPQSLGEEQKRDLEP